MDILKKYQLKFSKDKLIGKFAISTLQEHHILAELLTDLNNDPEFIEITTQNLNELFLGNKDLVESGGGVLQVDSNATSTLFAYDYNPLDFSNPDYTMPTKDYQEVLMLWKEYLLKDHVTIRTTTTIHAKKEIAFDLSRCIELHETSTAQTKEKAIAGRTKGLIEIGETVTWRAKHFGIYQKLQVKITNMEKFEYFTDTMQKGAFKRFVHQHIFKEEDGATVMLDVFVYQSPLGVLGKLADWLFLKRYMTNFLTKRNEIIKEIAESNEWKKYIPNNPNL